MSLQENSQFSENPIYTVNWLFNEIANFLSLPKNRRKSVYNASLKDRISDFHRPQLLLISQFYLFHMGESLCFIAFYIRKHDGGKIISSGHRIDCVEIARMGW